MSREWGREAFSEAVAGAGFTTHPGLIGRRTNAGRPGFSAREAVAWLCPEGFVKKATGFAPEPRFHSGESAEDAPVFKAEMEPLEGEVLPAIDAAEAFAAGFAEGERTAMLTASADAAACAQLLGGLSTAHTFDRGALARRLQQTVLYLVTKLVGEVGVSAEKLASRVEDAIGMLADVTEPARVHLHPDDLALIGTHLPAHVATVSNAQIERGGFRLETMSATIEDGPTLWLEQLSAELDRVAVPGA